MPNYAKIAAKRIADKRQALYLEYDQFRTAAECIADSQQRAVMLGVHAKQLEEQLESLHHPPNRLRRNN